MRRKGATSTKLGSHFAHPYFSAAMVEIRFKRKNLLEIFIETF